MTTTKRKTKKKVKKFPTMGTVNRRLKTINGTILFLSNALSDVYDELASLKNELGGK